MPVTPANPARPTTPSKAGITRNADGQQIIPASLRPDGTTRREIKVRPGYRPPEDVEVYKNRTAEAWKSRGSGGIPGAGSASDSDRKNTTANSNSAKRRAARKKAKEKDGERDDDEEDVEKEVKEVKQVKQVKEVKEVKGVKGVGRVEVKEVEVKEVKEVDEVKSLKEVKEAKEAKEVNEAKEAKMEVKTEGETEVVMEVPLAPTDQVASPEREPEQTQEEKEKQAKGLKKKIRQTTDLKNRQEGGETLNPDQLEKVSKLDELVRQLNSLGLK
ncbi:hypothetical protein Q9L58_000790 [Maublancomyces gigas]|uniref:WIBG Mago-binding domain-containing protein n=1 Tax=Discina gigas TaxID=1032678 RepID=A0ABR3GWA0_9PEZI